MDFIKRETVCEKLNDIGGCGADPDSWADGWDKAISEAIKIVEGIPATDVVHVVRCKDCKHYQISKKVYYCEVLDNFTPLDYFCSYGERTEDGE